MTTEANESLAGDRLVGVQAIGQFIDPNLSLWKVQRLLEEEFYPSWKEGRIYVASRRALRQHWERMTGTCSSSRLPKQRQQQVDGEAA